MFSDAKYLKNASSNAPNSSSSNIPPLSGQYQPIKSIINYSNSNISDLSSSNNSNSSNVKFSGLIVKEKIDDREKYLTAKYPNHQMALIKKRLKVEFWIDEQLKFLFNITDDNTKEDYDICADDLVDNLLDLDTDSERKFHILNQLVKAKKGKEDVMIFVDELLVKLRML